ncbi:uncharacterized protein LOC125244933 isoform X2 [Megalobrama amblycephala]|uniref:uncharacterized protein LOC125244933 isoform X2 n=1 Tax=Megalobrama amblycephala TaxID=75352 RepID=UPI0020141C93|nr:uncharacterized protein LOC125244933 isoform X2 [Megalobrama amblycephala]
MKALVCILLLLETFVFVVQQQVDGGLNENEISQQISSEDRRQNPPQTDTLRAEAATDSQQSCHLCFPEIHAVLRELTATVTEQKGNIRELTATVTELRDEMNKKNEEISNLTLGQVELKKENRGIFTAPLKGAYMFRVSVYGHGGTAATVSIIKNGEHVVMAHEDQAQNALAASNGVVLILEVGDVVYVRLRSGTRIADSENNHNTFSGFLLFPLREQELCRM